MRRRGIGPDAQRAGNNLPVELSARARGIGAIILDSPPSHARREWRGLRRS